MSIERCDLHDWRYDTDYFEQCPACGPTTDERMSMADSETPETGCKHGLLYCHQCDRESDLERRLREAETRIEQKDADLKATDELARLRGERADRFASAEAALSSSYVRLREIVGAMEPPSLESHKLWAYTERCARDMRDQLYAAERARDEALRDAERYRKLRYMHWNDSAIACVTNPRETVRLGTYCPSEEQLDELLDAIDSEIGAKGVK